MNLDLQQIWNGLRKRWWLALLVTLSAASVAYFYENSQQRVYQTQVTLTAEPLQPDNGAIEAIKKTMPTYAQKLGSKELVRQVLDDNLIRDKDPNVVAGQVEVQSQPDQNRLVMRVDDIGADGAALMADLISKAFVAQQVSLNQEATPGGNRTIWTITQAAEPASRPYKPRPLLATAAAALFGLVLGLLLAIGLELLDTTLKTPGEVRQYVGLNTLGVIPRERGIGDRGSGIGDQRAESGRQVAAGNGRVSPGQPLVTTQDSTDPRPPIPDHLSKEK